MVLPLLVPTLDHKGRTATACDLGGCFVASPVVMSLPADRFPRKKNIIVAKTPAPSLKRSLSLINHTQLGPVDSGSLSPKALELLEKININNAEVKSLPLQDYSVGALAAQGIHNSTMHSEDVNLERLAHENQTERQPLNHQEGMSASDDQRPRSTSKVSIQLASDGEIQVAPFSRKERIEAFDAERRRNSCRHDRNLVKLLKAKAARARPCSADQHANDAKHRTERIESFEAQRRQSSCKGDLSLTKLLKVQATQVPRPSSADQHASVAKRRAQYEVKRQEEMKKRKERAQVAKDFVRQCMAEWQVPAHVGQGIVGLSLLKAGLDGLGGIEKDVTIDMVRESYEKTKSDFYHSHIKGLLAQKGGWSSMCGTLGELILKGCAPWNWLSFLRSNLSDDILNSSKSADSFIKHVTDSSRFTCPICADSMFSISDDASGINCNVWVAESRKNEHWNNHACGHTFCRSCAERWAEVAVNEQRLQVRCPAPGCKYRLWDQDLKELLNSKMYHRHKEHLDADHLMNLKGLAKEDDVLMDWLRQHARPCPDCHVIVSRSEGCNSMLCVCGTRFCYACGFKGCQCGVKRRNDIWQPSA